MPRSHRKPQINLSSLPWLGATQVRDSEEITGAAKPRHFHRQQSKAARTKRGQLVLEIMKA